MSSVKWRKFFTRCLWVDHKWDNMNSSWRMCQHCHMTSVNERYYAK